MLEEMVGDYKCATGAGWENAAKDGQILLMCNRSWLGECCQRWSDNADVQQKLVGGMLEGMVTNCRCATRDG